MVYNVNLSGVANPQYNVSNPIQQNKDTKEYVNRPQDITKSLEALGIYNMALVKNKDDFKIEPLEIILDPNTKMSEIEGEQVCKPNGELDYIVTEDGNTETRYYPNSKLHDVIAFIEIRDLNTGKIIKTQSRDTEYNTKEFAGLTITENKADATYNTSYDKDMKLAHVGKSNHNDTINHNVYIENGRPVDYSMFAENKKGDIHVRLDKNMKITDIDNTHRYKNIEESSHIELKNGAIVSVEKRQRMLMPNYLERDTMQDTDVMPAEKYDKNIISKEAKLADGEITYYSNGKIKSITTQDDDLNKTYTFCTDGSLKEYSDNNSVKVEFEGNEQTITEYIDDETTKKTTYNKDGSYSVDYNDGKIAKYSSTHPNGKMATYNVVDLGNNHEIKSNYYNEKGFLEYSYEE